MHLLQAAAADDRDACIKWSLKLGYLTGAENEVRILPLFLPPLFLCRHSCSSFFR